VLETVADASGYKICYTLEKDNTIIVHYLTSKVKRRWFEWLKKKPAGAN
jgi:hypothetical protein